MITPSSHQPALTPILTGAAFISFSGVWVMWAGVEPNVSAFYRVFFGALFLLVACIRRREIRPVSRSTLLLIILCGLFFAADLYCWHASILFIGPGLATILGNFQVFILTVVSFVFFGEKIRWRFLLSIPLAFAGLLLIVGQNWSALPAEYRLGLLLGLATALFYSAFLLTLRAIQGSGETMSFFYRLMLVSCSSSVFLGLQLVWSDSGFALPDMTAIVSLLCLGLFSQTIGWSFIANSLPKLAPSVAGLILLLQPALAFVWDAALFSRSTTASNWLGAAITILAIYLGMTASRPHGQNR